MLPTTKVTMTGIFLILFLSFIIPREYTIEKLGIELNTPQYDEISPLLTSDGNTLYFTRVGYPEFDRQLIMEGEDMSAYPSENFYRQQLSWVYSQIAGEEITDPYNSKYNQDIWISNGVEGNFLEAYPMPSPLNNALPNSVCAVLHGGEQLILMNQFKPDGGMSSGFSVVKKSENGEWSFPESIDIEGFNQTGGEVSLYVNDEGQWMLLSMNDERSMGDNDIYISKKVGKNKWSKPLHLGNKINTKYRETTPYLSKDLRTIYFASNRPGGIGGMDIYYSVRQSGNWRDWSTPKKFYYPINSKYDDSQPMFNEKYGYLYFSSKRDGSSDIYRSKITESNILEYAYETVQVKGKIINKNNKQPISADIVVKLHEENKAFSTVNAQRGSFDLTIPKGVDIEVIPKKDGFIGHSKFFSFQNDRDYEILTNVNLFVEPIRRGNMLGHSPIYFDRSSPRILPNSLPELRRITKLLKMHPQVTIEIQGHTDNIGEIEDLIALSQSRAAAVRDYLIGQGIAGSRLSIKGLGSKYPVGSNQSEEERKRNRRVEMKVSVINQNMD
ncbi:MAG: OmpA family protein [Bacteroidia bacterium]|nr:OmpA family protein [Bacteroidia bacterium]